MQPGFDILHVDDNADDLRFFGIAVEWSGVTKPSRRLDGSGAGGLGMGNRLAERRGR